MSKLNVDVNEFKGGGGMKEEIINKLDIISTQLWTLGQEAVEDIPKISKELSDRIDDVITYLEDLEVAE